MNETALSEAVNTAMQTTITDTLTSLPGMALAVLIFVLIIVLGWVVATLLAMAFSRALKVVKLEEFLKTHKVEDSLGTVKISDVLAKIVKYYVFLVFLQLAVSAVQLGAITQYLNEVLIVVPAFIGGGLIVLLSVIFGEYLKEMIAELSKSPLVKLTARATKVVVIYVGVTMGLATAGFDTMLITGIFMTVLQALVFGIALGVGIAFGLGGQDDARDIIKSGRKNLKI